MFSLFFTFNKNESFVSGDKNIFSGKKQKKILSIFMVFIILKKAFVSRTKLPQQNVFFHPAIKKGNYSIK